VVKFVGPSSTHPLSSFNGTTPSPIPQGATTDQTITFANEGTYGFHCTVHASMQGAIQVVP
jgi:plastocyanin